jgi:hypothetical protein
MYAMYRHVIRRCIARRSDSLAVAVEAPACGGALFSRVDTRAGPVSTVTYVRHLCASVLDAVSVYVAGNKKGRDSYAKS